MLEVWGAGPTPVTATALNGGSERSPGRLAGEEGTRPVHIDLSPCFSFTRW